MPTAVNLAEKLAAFSEHWSPKIVAKFKTSRLGSGLEGESAGVAEAGPEDRGQKRGVHRASFPR